MSPPRRPSSSFGGGKAQSAAPAPRRAAPSAPPAPPPSPFLEALVELLRSRNLEIPPGLPEAPPEAYAGQGEAAVQAMSRLKDEDLVERAGKVAGWGRRQADRAEQAWESSPIIAELRRRGLAEPARPARVVGAAFSMKKPLADWTDDELEEAAAAWARLGAGSRR